MAGFSRAFTGVVPPLAPVVLVVSDDRRVGQALVAYLSTSAASALAAVGPLTYAALDQRGPGIADVMVCDLDGCDLAVALCWVERAGVTLGLPVVAVSSNPTTRASCLERGAAAAADKSSDVENLARQVWATGQPGPKE